MIAKTNFKQYNLMTLKWASLEILKFLQEMGSRNIHFYSVIILFDSKTILYIMKTLL